MDWPRVLTITPPKLLCMVKRRRIAADTVYTLNERGPPSRRSPLGSSCFPLALAHNPSSRPAFHCPPRAASLPIGACGVVIAVTATSGQPQELAGGEEWLVLQRRQSCGLPERSLVGLALLHDPPSHRYPHRRSFDVEYRRPLTSQFTSRQLNDGESGSHNNLRVLNGLQNIGPAG